MTYLSPPAFYCRNADLKILCIIDTHSTKPSLQDLGTAQRLGTHIGITGGITDWDAKNAGEAVKQYTKD